MSSSGRAAAHLTQIFPEAPASNVDAPVQQVDNTAFALGAVEHLATLLGVGLDSVLANIPYSLHIEFWSGGNPSCAVIVVQWTGVVDRERDKPEADQDDNIYNDHVNKVEDPDEDVPKAWGFSASDWTNCGSDVFHMESLITAKPAGAGSAPSSPRLGSAPLHGSASPRFPASIGNSPRIRPTTGWSTPSSPGGTMNRAASYTGASPVTAGQHSSTLGGRRMTVNKAGGSVIVTASLPGTPAISSGTRFSPFFGPVSGPSVRASRSGGSIQRLNEGGEHSDGDEYFPRQQGSPSMSRSGFVSPDGRGRSASITSIPEISLGAPAVNMRSHSTNSSAPISTRGNESDLTGANEGIDRGPRKHKRRIGSASTDERQRAGRTHRRRWPIAMHRLAITYAALIHYLSTYIALRALLLAAQGQSSSGNWKGPLLSSTLCGMSLDARGRAENLGLRRSSLFATVVLFVVVLNLSYL